jgi:hypothetical protein
VEEFMPTVIAYHEIDDKDHWLASDNREKFFGPLGVTGIREFVDPENPERVAVLMEISDMDRVMAALQTEEAATVMSEDGVRSDSLVLLVAAK